MSENLLYAPRKYVINLIDDYSGLTIFYFVKHNSDSLLATTKHIADIAPYGHVKCLRTDNGMEFTSESFPRFLRRNKLKHKESSLYSLHQNETAERSRWTLFYISTCLLIDSKLSPNLWVYALMVSAYVRNRC